MANSRKILIPYAPRPAFAGFHERSQRWACIVAHRRAGKTVAAINELIRAALRCERPEPRLAYVAPYTSQAKDLAWGYLKQYTAPIPGGRPNVSELRIDLPNGGRVRLYGADNYNRLRGIYLDGVVLDEYADMDPRAWSEVIRPALADRAGWATFIGTPKGRNGFWEIYEKAKVSPDWFALRLKSSQTGLVPEAELEAMRRELSADEYAREMETSFDAAVAGAYFADALNRAESEGRIGRAPHDPAAEVHAAFDLGIGDATAVWLAQFVGREIRLIDYIENSGVALDWYARALRERPYLYAPLILPHDAKARELGTGKSRLELLEAMGFAVRLAPRLSPLDGIEAVRRLLPRTWIDADRCGPGLRALRDYREHRDAKRRVALGPLHDWTSHAADALRYLMTAYEEPQSRGRATTRARGHSGGWMG